MLSSEMMLVACDWRGDSEKVEFNAIGIVPPRQYDDEIFDVELVLPVRVRTKKMTVMCYNTIILATSIDLTAMEKQLPGLLLLALSRQTASHARPHLRSSWAAG